MRADTKKSRTTTGKPMSILDVWIVKIGNVIGWLYFVAVTISVFEVVMRYGFNKPTSWAHESTLMLVGVGMLWGGTYCMAEDRHIRVTVVRDAMGPRLRRCVDVVVGVLTLLFCAGLAWAGYILAHKALIDPTGVFRLQRSGSAFNSPGPAVVKTVLFVVVVLMTLQAIYQLWVTIKAIWAPLPDQETSK